MGIISKKENSANGDQQAIELLENKVIYENTIYLTTIEAGQILGALRSRPLLSLLQEADKALLEGKAAVVHSCLRKAITELETP